MMTSVSSGEVPPEMVEELASTWELLSLVHQEHSKHEDEVRVTSCHVTSPWSCHGAAPQAPWSCGGSSKARPTFGLQGRPSGLASHSVARVHGVHPTTQAIFAAYEEFYPGVSSHDSHTHEQLHVLSKG